jgi:Flp pilus assembly protein TadG
MMRSHRRPSRRGAAAVELAVLVPFLTFLMLITIDWARVFYYSVTITNAARQGALYACDPYAPSQSRYGSIADAALADATNLDPAPTVTTTYVTDAGGNQWVNCNVTWQFSTITNYPGIPTPMNLSRTVRMRMAPSTPG